MPKRGFFLTMFMFSACAQVPSSSPPQSPRAAPAPLDAGLTQPAPLRDSLIKTAPQPPIKKVGTAGGYVSDLYQIDSGSRPTALQGLPKDKYGLPDWVEAMNRKLINPQGTLDLTAQEIPPFNLEIVMPAKTGLIEGAHFPHSTHTLWIDCVTCHDKIFVPKIGANNLTMVKITKGESCGVCHGKVSFPLNHCERCHLPSMTDGKNPGLGGK